MDKEELKKKYDELITGIGTARMFDGRNTGVDVYICEECGIPFYTRYKDKGVTPFTIKCRKDGCSGTMVHKHTISEIQAKACGITVHNWVRPTFEQTMKLNEGSQQHVLNGGLMLDDELDKDNDVAKEKLNQVQEILDSLQNEGATFLFIGHEGNHFVISGNPMNITAQIIFAMCRYPIVRDIIKNCAEHFDGLNKECGDKVRSTTMDHLIEQNSGN